MEIIKQWYIGHVDLSETPKFKGRKVFKTISGEIFIEGVVLTCCGPLYEIFNINDLADGEIEKIKNMIGDGE